MFVENYRLNRIERFEAETVKRYPHYDRVEIQTIQVELSSQGLKFEHWSEKGIVTKKQYLMPSTHVKLSDILVPRNKLKVKGVRYSVQVMFFEGEQELAKEVAKESLQLEINRDKASLDNLTVLLNGQKMI